jgi:hypothetical protein
MRAPAWTAAAGVLLALVGGSALARVARDRFDHFQHRDLFPTCAGCHVGVAEGEGPIWPAAGDCTACHDGTVEEKVEWSAPTSPRVSNLRFTHESHAREFREHQGADSTIQCGACHNERGQDPMQVRPAVVNNCFDCHGIKDSHLEAPDSTCATCHVQLVQAVRLTRADVSRFPVPPSHKAPDFIEDGHGRQAEAGPGKVAASCATCHARDFCAECHVNAPEVAAIQALAADPRSLGVRVELREPSSHRRPDFLRRHGEQLGKDGMRCATCHTRESCLACHVGTPSQVQAMSVAAEGRGRGAEVERERPRSHGIDFSEIHADPAAARPQSCSTCHARTQCLDCHRPDPSNPPPGYHPAGFLTTHPAAAYSRDDSCADCHNQSQFCADCHLNAGLGSTDGLRNAGYHDAKANFFLNHGQAARQSLESCVSCHSERDCLSCHSARGGRRFNPHGPGFDARTLRQKNPSMCTVCHGAAIPGE